MGVLHSMFGPHFQIDRIVCERRYILAPSHSNLLLCMHFNFGRFIFKLFFLLSVAPRSLSLTHKSLWTWLKPFDFISFLFLKPFVACQPMKLNPIFYICVGTCTSFDFCSRSLHTQLNLPTQWNGIKIWA